jgi:hypothetical protein
MPGSPAMSMTDAFAPAPTSTFNWRQTRIGWDTADLTLDVVVHANGAVSYKDEDELDWAQQQGVYRADEAARIRQVGEIARDHAKARRWPLNIDWTRWVPAGHLDLPSPDPVWERLGQ